MSHVARRVELSNAVVCAPGTTWSLADIARLNAINVAGRDYNVAGRDYTSGSCRLNHLRGGAACVFVHGCARTTILFLPNAIG